MSQKCYQKSFILRGKTPNFVILILNYQNNENKLFYSFLGGAVAVPVW